MRDWKSEVQKYQAVVDSLEKSIEQFQETASIEMVEWDLNRPTTMYRLILEDLNHELSNQKLYLSRAIKCMEGEKL